MQSSFRNWSPPPHWKRFPKLLPSVHFKSSVWHWKHLRKWQKNSKERKSHFYAQKVVSPKLTRKSIWLLGINSPHTLIQFLSVLHSNCSTSRHSASSPCTRQPSTICVSITSKSRAPSEPTATSLRQPASSTAHSPADAFTWNLSPPPRPPINEDDSVQLGCPFLYYQLFTTTNLLNWKHHTPSYSEKLQAMIDLFESIFHTHKPTQDNCCHLLLTLFNTEKCCWILSEAQRWIQG